jgi:hypothetical protein
MDHRQRKLEKKRKKRAARKRTRGEAIRKPGGNQALIRLASRAPFGPCAVSRGWDDDGGLPSLVTALVTHGLPDGRLLPSLAMVDRTCLGVKDAFVAAPVSARQFDGFCERVGTAQGGMDECEPLVAQSIVYHAIAYARRLGFEPHPSFPDVLFGPRPAALIATPWHENDEPIYLAGPDDNVRSILGRLESAVGRDRFRFVAEVGEGPGLLDLADEDFEVLADDEADLDDRDGAGDRGEGREGVVEPYDLVGEIAHLVRRCEQGESVVIGLGGFVLFSSTAGDAWLLDAFENGALNLVRDHERADVTISEDDDQVSIHWPGTYTIRGPDFVTDALHGRSLIIRGYPTDTIRSAIERLRQVAETPARTGSGVARRSRS